MPILFADDYYGVDGMSDLSATTTANFHSALEEFEVAWKNPTHTRFKRSNKRAMGSEEPWSFAVNCTAGHLTAEVISGGRPRGEAPRRIIAAAVILLATSVAQAADTAGDEAAGGRSRDLGHAGRVLQVASMPLLGCRRDLAAAKPPHNAAIGT